MDRIEKAKLIQAVKIAVGSCTAILIAEYFELEYAASAGIIALLTIQNTRKDTLWLSARRLLSFAAMLLLSFVIFYLIGLHWGGFGLIVFLLAGASWQFGWQDTFSVNAVLCTHFLVSRNFHPSFILNEFGILLIGTVIAVCLNAYMPGRAADIRSDIREIERQLQLILSALAGHMMNVAETGSVGTKLERLEVRLSRAEERAFENMNNTWYGHARYYIEYMEMRMNQCGVLRNIHDSVHRLTHTPVQAGLIADFMIRIADSLHEQNNVLLLLDELEQILRHMRQEPLPAAREEFENRAVLYHILMQLEVFLQLKRRFVSSLSEEQIKIYWEQ